MTPKMSRKDTTIIPSMEMPGFRTSLAVQNGVEKNLLLRTWGGLGDQICAEPTLRHALKSFNECKITLATELPELFTHLPFHDVYDLKNDRPILDDYLVLDTITTPSTLTWQFVSHMLTHCVDFPTICALRGQLAPRDKEVFMEPPRPDHEGVLSIARAPTNFVIVHAGKHWESKTFPKDWWDATLAAIKGHGFTPVLIGKEVNEGQGTVDTDTAGCVDLREKTTLLETIWLLQNAAVVVCNDSSPLHMAATGGAFIGFLSTLKRPDLITHWRRGQFGWRMEHLALGGLWEIHDGCPNKAQTVTLDKCPESLMRQWLPHPEIIGQWCKEKMDVYRREV